MITGGRVPHDSLAERAPSAAQTLAAICGSVCRVTGFGVKSAQTREDPCETEKVGQKHRVSALETLGSSCPPREKPV